MFRYMGGGKKEVTNLPWWLWSILLIRSSLNTSVASLEPFCCWLIEGVPLRFWSLTSNSYFLRIPTYLVPGLPRDYFSLYIIFVHSIWSCFCLLEVTPWVSSPSSKGLASQWNLSKVYWDMLHLLNLLALTRLAPPCKHFFLMRLMWTSIFAKFASN